MKIFWDNLRNQGLGNLHLNFISFHFHLTKTICAENGYKVKMLYNEHGSIMWSLKGYFKVMFNAIKYTLLRGRNKFQHKSLIGLKCVMKILLNNAPFSYIFFFICYLQLSYLARTQHYITLEILFTVISNE